MNFNQEDINKLTEYILNNPKLVDLAIHENWRGLYPELLYDAYLPQKHNFGLFSLLLFSGAR